MRQKKFSIIGCQHAHIEIFIEEMQALEYQCAGIYEQENQKLARSVAEKFGIPIVTEKETLLEPGIEIVGCASINNEKIDIIELCERHGKHVMVDKPAVTGRSDYERLVSVRERGKIQVGMLLTERFNPPVYTLKKLIEQGILGSLVSIGIRKPHRLNPGLRPEWFFSKERNGGVVIDLLIHDFDLLRWFTGKEVAAAEGFMAKNILPAYAGFYDAAFLQVVMEGNTAAQLYADWHTPETSWTWGDGRIFVSGTKGCAEIRTAGDPFISESPLLLQVTDAGAPSLVDVECPLATVSEDFLNRIRGDDALLTFDDLLKATKATIDADENVRILNAFT